MYHAPEYLLTPFVTPQSQGVLFFFTTLRSLLRQRNICHDKITLSCTPGPICCTCAPPTRSVARVSAWPDLLRACAPNSVYRACMSFVVTQHNATLSRQSVSVTCTHPCCDAMLASLSRHRALLHDMENPMSWNFLLQRKVHPVAT